MRRHEYVRLAIELIILLIAIAFVAFNMFEVKTLGMFVGLVYLGFAVPIFLLFLSSIFWKDYAYRKGYRRADDSNKFWFLTNDHDDDSQKSQGSL